MPSPPKKQTDAADEDLLCPSSNESDRELYVAWLPPDTTVYSEYVMMSMSTSIAAKTEINGHSIYMCTGLTCVKFFSTNSIVGWQLNGRQTMHGSKRYQKSKCFSSTHFEYSLLVGGLLLLL